MAPRPKRAADSPSAGAISLGRLLFVAAAATALAFAAASLTPFEGRASSRGAAVSIVASSSIVSICPSEGARPSVKLSAQGVAPDCGARYKWAVSGGHIIGEGREVVWDFSGVEVDFSGDRPSKNYYEVALTVEGGASCEVERAVSPPVRVVAWSCPPGVGVNTGAGANGSRVSAPPAARCPNINLCCHAVGFGQHMPLSATLSGGTPGIEPIFRWLLHGGEVVSGQGTASVMVDLSDYEGQPIVATLEVGGYGPRCSASCAPPPPPTIVCRPHYVSETRYERVYIPRPIVKRRTHPRPRLRHTGFVARRRPRGRWELRRVITSTLVPCPSPTSQGKRKS